MNDSEKIFELIRWWEKRRLLYNGIMAVIGITTILILIPHYVWKAHAIQHFTGIIFFAILANVCFTAGWALPLWGTALKLDQENLGKYRLVTFITGTVFSALLLIWTVMDYAIPYGP